MAVQAYGLLVVPLGDKLDDGFVLRAPGEIRRSSFAVQDKVLPLGWRGLPADHNCTAPLHYDTEGPARGIQALWLEELKTYEWSFSGDTAPSCSLAYSTRKADWQPVEEDRSLWRGTFRFVNFLGTAWLGVGGRKDMRIYFEVVTRKLSYEQEYRVMVEAIAAECQELLLAWDSPTSLSIAADPTRESSTLIERFLFLRHALGPDRLDLFLEMLQRRPHSRLAIERRWSPAWSDLPQRFYQNPLRHGRDWERTKVGPVNGFSPSEIEGERKFDTVDTAPNRFVKFALRRFAGLCAEVKDLPDVSAGKGSAWLEAEQMEVALENLRGQPFFANVGELRRIPLENQTLQKREGYREILQAWLMVDAASQIDWPGRKDAYDGTNRDVATLYEYWLYFTLVKMLREGMNLDMVSAPLPEPAEGWLPFCCASEGGGMTINLKQGSTSFTRFNWTGPDGESLRVHFFYNRRFGGRTAVHRSGAYSRGFRPDFTLVILPGDSLEQDWREAEQTAEAAGRIAYVHFDAKYRIEQLTELVGGEEPESKGDDTVPDEEERTAKATGTFKNADLYKMHTYNDAIRRTAGSYVLFPGDNPMNSRERGGNRFERYHEMVPGIGAFALKPKADGDGEPEGLAALRDFVGDLFRHHANRFTQSYRINYFTHETVLEPPPAYPPPTPSPVSDKPPRDTQVLLGFVRSAKEADECRENLTFYCHAIEWSVRESGGSRKGGRPVNLGFNPFSAEQFVAFQAGETFPWIAKIESVSLISAESRAAEKGQPLEKMSAAYYYRFTLGLVTAGPIRDVSTIVGTKPGKPLLVSLDDLERRSLARVSGRPPSKFTSATS